MWRLLCTDIAFLHSPFCLSTGTLLNEGILFFYPVTFSYSIVFLLLSWTIINIHICGHKEKKKFHFAMSRIQKWPSVATKLLVFVTEDTDMKNIKLGKYKVQEQSGSALCKWWGSRGQALAWTKQEFEWIGTQVNLVAHWVRLSNKLKASLAKSHPLVLFFSLTHLCCSLFILKGQIFFLFSNSVWIQHNLFPKMRKTIL